MADTVPVENDPRFRALPPNEQATVRAAWIKKLNALSPNERTMVLDAWKKKYPAAEPKRQGETLDERGQPIPRELPGGNAAAVADLEATIPMIRKDMTLDEKLGHVFNRPPEGLVKAAKSIENPVGGGAAEFAAEQVTPLNLAMGLGVAKLPEVGAKAAAGAFGSMALKAMAQRAPEAYELWKAGDRTGALRLLTKLGLTGLVGALGVGHAVKGLGAPVEPYQGPSGPWPDDRTPPVPEQQGPRRPIPGREPRDEGYSLDVGPQPRPGTFDIDPVQRANRGALEALSLDPLEDVPIPYEPSQGGARGPRPPMEPSETVPQAEYPGMAGRAPRGEITPESLIGEPEPAIDAPELDVLEPEALEQTPRPRGPAQEQFIPEDLAELPSSAIGTELARQEARLEGQRAAQAELDAALMGSESAKDIARQAAETEQRVIQLREMFEREQAAREPPVIPNPPAHPILEAQMRDELKVRGVDPDSPQAVLDLVSRHAELRKPANVRTVGIYPVSKSVEAGKSYEIDLSRNSPSSVLHETTHTKEAEGGPTPPEGPGANDSIVSGWLAKNNTAAKTVRINEELSAVADTIENSAKQREIAFEDPEWIGKQGQITEARRREFRESGEKPETRDLAIAEEDVHVVLEQVTEATRVAKQATAIAEELQMVSGDAQSRSRAGVAAKQAEQAWAAADSALRRLRTTHFAAGRTVRAFGNPLPPDVVVELRRTGRMIENETRMRLREPIYDDIMNVVKAWKAGEMGWKEAIPQLGRDVTFEIATNLFTYWSALLDTAMNSSEIAKQMLGSVGADAVRVAGGRFDFPNLRSWGYAFADRASHKPMPQMLERMLEHKTAMGEEIKAGWGGERGAYLRRTTPLRKGIDYARGAGVYAKVAVDRAAGNFAATATLWAEAAKATPKGLSGMEARAWRRQFVENPTSDALLAAESAGRKAKMDRPLSKFEESWAASTPYRLFIDIFARWPLQAGRAVGEWFGLDTELMGKLRRGEPIKAEQYGRWVAQSLAGPMGLYLAGTLLYDHTDFRSMEYVDDDQNRKRISMAPVPELLFVTAVLKSFTDSSENRMKHLENAKAALQFVSLPGAKAASTIFFGGEPGGIFSAIIGSKLHGGDKNQAIDPRGVKRDAIDQLNRMIPGQATLSVLKYIFDPLEREGFGARIPGYSETLPYRPSTTQGGPMQRRRQLPGGAGEVTTSSNIPGSTRELDPVEALLMKYGQPVYRGPRTSLPGANAPDLKVLRDAIARSRKGGALPGEDDLRREWDEELGNARQSILGPLAYRLHLQGNDLEKMEPERARYVVRKLDAAAARLATAAITARYGGQPKPFRAETMRELTGPKAMHDLYLEAKAAHEAAQAEAFKE